MRLYSDEKVAGFLRDGWWSGKTFLDLLAGHVAARPDRIRLVDPAHREAITDGAPRRLTWAEVDVEVGALARALFRAGVRADDVVGIQLPNGVELAMAYLAVAKLGAGVRALSSKAPIYVGNLMPVSTEKGCEDGWTDIDGLAGGGTTSKRFVAAFSAPDAASKSGRARFGMVPANWVGAASEYPVGAMFASRPGACDGARKAVRQDFSAM